LNKVGFDWGGKSIPWERTYEDLVGFVKEFGHARVPHGFPENPSLGNWVNNQRKSYKMFLKGDTSSRMTEGRVGLLNTVGFEWVIYNKTEKKGTVIF